MSISDSCTNKGQNQIGACGINKIEELESALHKGGFRMLEIPKEALFLAGKTYRGYRKGKATKISPLPDFYIGAQAAVLGMDLITRDKGNIGLIFLPLE